MMNMWQHLIHTMDIRVKLRDGKIRHLNVKLNIGDYVRIKDIGGYYPTYTQAFLYFWGINDTYHPTNEDKRIDWKIINMAYHSIDFPNDGLLVHIRSRDGKNLVVGEKYIELSKFHIRNRKPIKPIMIYQLPYFNEELESHSWTEKLFEYCKD